MRFMPNIVAIGKPSMTYVDLSVLDFQKSEFLTVRRVEMSNLRHHAKFHVHRPNIAEI